MLKQLVLLTATALLIQSDAPPAVLKIKVEGFQLNKGIKSIGGATMRDAVNRLRSLVKIGICLEEVEFDPSKDALTLGAALEKLESLRRKRPLSKLDQARWDRYQELAKKEDPSTFVAGRISQSAFDEAVRGNFTLQAILDELVKQDPAYKWKVTGTRRKEVIVIQPRAGSVLSWRVDPICKVTKVPKVYKGSFGRILDEHRIALVQFELLPNAPIDLCREGLTAEDVLNLTAQAAGSGLSWTLAGTKDHRFLTFSK